MDAASVLWARLEEGTLVEGKPIDGFTAGTFIDMWGRKFQFEENELPLYVENTMVAIEATKLSDGEVRGLPIDCQGHDNEDAAGWIVGVELVDGMIRFAVKWTDVGADLIKRGLRAFFSATANVALKVILGGSLTNWPATRDNKTGAPLLSPVELAGRPGLYQLEEEEAEQDDDLPESDDVEGLSYQERQERIAQAWHAFEPSTDGPEGYVDSIYEDYVIIERTDGTYKVPYSWEGERVIFAAEREWTLVRKTWLEATKEAVQGFFKKPIEGENDMAKKMSDEDRTALAAELVPQLIPALVAALSGNGEVAELELDVANLNIEPLAELIDEKADAKVAILLAEETRKGEIASFVAEATGGTEEKPVGLPVVSDDLVAFLSSLDEKQLVQAKSIFGAIIEDGVKHFAELGHSRKVKGNTELSDPMKAHLREYLTSDGHTVGEFFKMNADMLGAQEDYDLSAFEVKE